MTLVLIILLIVLLGGGGWCVRRVGWSDREIGGLLAAALVAVLVVWLVNELILPIPPMPAQIATTH